MEEVLDLVSETFAENGLLAKTISNYKVRPQQIELSQKIQECIEKRKPLLAEAPTGVGKSLAALVPAFEYIKKTDKPVIVVTSGIVLQEQYINKDIPLLERLYGFKVNPVLIKGRNNYTCPKKVNDARNGKMGATTSDKVKELQGVLSWALTTETGDKSEMDFVPSYGAWAQFSCVEGNECTGKQCPFYTICPYYRERSKVTTSKLIVCNYHYFFTALDSEAPMLPSNAEVFIMDEGHEINAIARDFQEKKYSVQALKNQFDFFAKAMDRAKHTELSESANGLLVDMELDMVNFSLTELFVGLTHEYKSKRNIWDFLPLELPTRTYYQRYARDHITRLKHASNEAEKYLAKLGFSFEQLSAMSDYWSEEALDWMIAVYKTMEFLTQKVRLLEYMFAFNDIKEEDDVIFWLYKQGDYVSIHAKPIDGSGITSALFKGQGKIPIVMSATLTSNKQFHHVKKQLGIENDKERFPVEEIMVKSPFPLDENMLWYLPADTPAGNEKDHLSFVLEDMKRIIEELQGRTLCLFTSKSNMIKAKEFLKMKLPIGINVISQEDMPKQKIIEYTKEKDHTVILGTKSFFTGVDIQGHHISAVLIDKLPFPMLGDPVNDYLMNEPLGFHKFSLPEAIISMKQAMGRLNRTNEDKGIVAVYDGRLSTARYKNKIFNSFDFKVQATKDWGRVREYIRDLELPRGR